MLITRILTGVGVVLLVAVLLIAVFWKQLPFRLILPYLGQTPIVVEGDVHKVTIPSQTVGEQTFFVYLPTGYNDSHDRYATLYHLHGAFMRESWTERECYNLGAKVEAAVSKGIIDPMIVVCPVDPDGDRMWSDSFDGNYMASTALIDVLIPYVDSTYRTNATRESRVLQGFSMGGFGTVTNGFKHPDLFAALIVWDGALHDWQTISTDRQSIMRKMFGTEAYFDMWSPHKVIENSAEIEPALFMVVGTMDATRNFASRFKPKLESTQRDFIYYDSTCPHSLFCMMDELGDEAFKFLAKNVVTISGESESRLVQKY